jgi:F-type H+-transporting ATPase subunit delta
MKGLKTASRYAKALLDLATEQNILEKVYEDVKLIAHTCKTQRELVLLLDSPLVKTDKKQAILQSVFAGNLSTTTELFIRLLVSKRRERSLPAIAEECINQYKIKKKILTAVITSAQGLDEELRKKVLELVKKSSDSEIELVEKVNDTLIGGFTLQVGDKRVDASIAKQIKQMAMNFSENPYIKEY